MSNKLNNKITALSGVALKAPRSRRAGRQKMVVSLVTVLSAVEGRVHKVSNKLNNKIAALSGVALKAPRSRRAVVVIARKILEIPHSG